MSKSPKNARGPDSFAQGGSVATELAYHLMAEGIGSEELPVLIRAFGDAEVAVGQRRSELERHEARLDGAAVQAGETLVRLSHAADQLSDNRSQLVEGGLADDAMLQELDFQINALRSRIDQVKSKQAAENRVIEGDLSPDRDRHVTAELARQSSSEQLIQRVMELKPEPCPASLRTGYAKLTLLVELL